MRWLVTLADGSRVFVKIATDADTLRWLRDEFRVYQKGRADFLPRMFGWHDCSQLSFLVLEDLSQAHWPPSWTDKQAHAVHEMLERVRSLAIPDLPPAKEILPENRWSAVAEDPEPFLSLGFVTRSWLDHALPLLIQAEQSVVFEGDATQHGDVRSDNLCFVGDQPRLLDWNFAYRGHAQLDLASWLPSLHREGGPAPETFLSHAPGLAAWISGYFACHAGLPVIPQAPRVREVQRFQLEAALPWASRALQLPAPDGQEPTFG